MAKRTHNSDELFELKWNNYSQSITEEIYNIRQNDCLVDLTFCCEGITIGCHKLLIFACSPVLRQILTKNPSPHPIIYVTDIKLPILQALLKYIYQGEVQISKSDLVSFMKAADSFQIRGLQSKRNLSSTADSTPVDTSAKKRRTYDTSAGPSSGGTFSLATDPLTSQSTTSTSMHQHDQHDTAHDSHLDFSEFENECSFGANDESMDESRFAGLSMSSGVQQTAQKLRRFIKSSGTGIEVMHEYEQHGALTDEKREDLSQIVAEFMAKGVVKGGRTGHEAIAEATLLLFPGTFEDDPKTLAELLYNRLGRQTQQRYGAESPEVSIVDIKEEPDVDLQEVMPQMSISEPVHVIPTPDNDVNSYGSPEELERTMIEIRGELEERSSQWLTNMFKNHSHVTWNTPVVNVGVGQSGRIFCSVECFMCQKPLRVCFVRSTRIDSFVKWIFKRGNFNKHFQRSHTEYFEPKRKRNQPNVAHIPPMANIPSLPPNLPYMDPHFYHQ